MPSSRLQRYQLSENFKGELHHWRTSSEDYQPLKEESSPTRDDNTQAINIQVYKNQDQQWKE